MSEDFDCDEFLKRLRRGDTLPAVPDIEGLLEKLNQVRTISELDALRKETFEAMSFEDGSMFNDVQLAFIRAKNRLNGIL